MGVGTVDPDANLWQWVAYELRHERQQRGWSLAQVGRVIHADRTNVSHIEAADRKLSAAQAKRLDEAWETGGRFERLVRYASRMHDPSWEREYFAYEERADEIRTYEPLWIPGLLQTEGYARAALAGGLNKAVEVRLARQKVLNRARVWVLLDEAALLRPVGGPQVMQEQIARLLEESRRPNVVLRVVPLAAGAYIGLDGPVTIITQGKVTVAYTEACGGGRLFMDPDTVRQRQVEFDIIGADALSRAATRELLQRRMDEHARAVA